MKVIIIKRSFRTITWSNIYIHWISIWNLWNELHLCNEKLVYIHTTVFMLCIIKIENSSTIQLYNIGFYNYLKIAVQCIWMSLLTNTKINFISFWSEYSVKIKDTTTGLSNFSWKIPQWNCLQCVIWCIINLKRQKNLDFFPDADFHQITAGINFKSKNVYKYPYNYMYIFLSILILINIYIIWNIYNL